MQIKCWTRKIERSSVLKCFNLLAGGNLIQLVPFITEAVFGKAIVAHMNDSRMTYTNENLVLGCTGNSRRQRKCLKKRKKNNSWESYEAYVEEWEKLDWKEKKSMGRDWQSNTFWEGRGDWMVLGWGLTEELWRTLPGAEKHGFRSSPAG